MTATFKSSPQRYARLAGVLYLAIILLGAFGELFVRATMVVFGNAAATANNIAASPSLWRAGIVGDLLMHVADLPVILLLYFLLRPVNENLALLATFINLIQTAVLAANKINLLLPLFLLADASYMKAFSPEQLHALSAIAINTHAHGFAIGLVFFGFACLIRGYLIFKSGYWPKILGTLMFLAGLSYLTNSFALLLAPAFADMIFPAVLLPALVGELSFCLWLIVKGVDVEQWQQRAGSTT